MCSRNFRQEYEVPKDYWTGGGDIKRAPEADMKHAAITKKLAQAAAECDRSSSPF